jgi:subtilisin
MSHRRAGRFRDEEKLASREAMERAVLRVGDLRSSRMVHDSAPADGLARRVLVFEAEPAEVAVFRSFAPEEVIVEPEMLRWPLTVYPPGFRALQGEGGRDLPPAGRGRRVRVEVVSGGEPLAGAQVLLFLIRAGSGPDFGARTIVEATTGASGRVELEHGTDWKPAAVLALPEHGAWGRVVRNVRDPLAIDCPPLPDGRVEPWWRHALRQDGAGTDGAGIRIGVADTGCGPHGALAHVVDAGAFLEGAHFPGEGADVDRHGTHVCGIVGARPTRGGLAGLAPAATLVAARVFPRGGGASQADVANAIDALSRSHACDLLNLSLGSPNPSTIERDAMIDAAERGTLCVCAAGNDGEDGVAYPARYEVAVAVGALGSDDAALPGSLAELDKPVDADRYGAEGLFLAAFSNRGWEIDVAAPGSAIVSTVPARNGRNGSNGAGAADAEPYADMSGTSMAAPAIVAALAVLLAADERYRSMPRDHRRSATARSRLRQSCRDLGLPERYVGFGIPSLV